MTEEPENLVLTYLRALRADISDIKETQREHGYRLTRIEGSIAGLRRDQAGDAETVAHLGARIDGLRDDVNRIKRRLDIIDEPPH
ncbi:MAG: hypothetical protein WCJ64_10395 [Rhodospirillaceae bacterium]